MDQVSDVVDALIKIKLAMRGTSQDIEKFETIRSWKIALNDEIIFNEMSCFPFFFSFEIRCHDFVWAC